MAYRKPITRNEIQQVAREYVSRARLVCVSSWVEASQAAEIDGFGVDEIQNMYEPIVCKHCGCEITQAKHDWVDGSSDGYCDKAPSEDELDEDDNVIETTPGDHEPENEDPDPQEIYEWYAVGDSGFEYAIKEAGQPYIEDAQGVFLWGRTCTGQACYLDSWIEEIAKGLEWVEVAP